MQTFLPYASFRRTASVLDRQRLGKQRIEALYVLRSLAGEADGWKTHPVLAMWRGHEHALAEYALEICHEWVRRGYQDTRIPLILPYLERFPDTGPPAWVGNRAFHRSHQSNLLRKFPEHYVEWFSKVPDDLPYVWPVSSRG